MSESNIKKYLETSNKTTTTKHPAETLFKWAKDRLNFAKAIHNTIDLVGKTCFGKGIGQTKCTPTESIPLTLGFLDSPEFFNLALTLILDEDHQIQELSAGALWRLVEIWKEMEDVLGMDISHVKFWKDLDKNLVDACSDYVKNRTHFLGQSALCACDGRNHPLMRSLGVTRQLVASLWDDVESVRNVASNLMSILEGSSQVSSDLHVQLSKFSNGVSKDVIKFQQERAALLLTQQHKLVTYLESERRNHQQKIVPVSIITNSSPRRPSKDANAFLSVMPKTWSSESLSEIDLLTPWAPQTRCPSATVSRRPSWEHDLLGHSLAEFGFHVESSPLKHSPLRQIISVQVVELEREDALPPLEPKSKPKPHPIVTEDLTGFNVSAPRSTTSTTSSSWSQGPITSSDWSPASACSTNSLGSLVGGMRNWNVESPSKAGGPVRVKKSCDKCFTHHTTEWQRQRNGDLLCSSCHDGKSKKKEVKQPKKELEELNWNSTTTLVEEEEKRASLTSPTTVIQSPEFVKPSSVKGNALGLSEKSVKKLNNLDVGLGILE